MYIGDYAEDYADLNFKFTTRNINAQPDTLTAGAISVYKSNNTTQSVAGVTLTADFDGVTGLNNVKIDLSADAFYETGEDYSCVLTAGTVDGDSAVGEVVASFSIQNRYSTVSPTRAAYLDELAAANIPTDIDALLTRLTATRAGYLDELGPTNLPTDIDALLARLTAIRATYLDELGPTNMPADIDIILGHLDDSKIMGVDELKNALLSDSEDN